MTTREGDPELAKLVANERIKLTATYLNGVALAVLAVGGLAPVFATAPTPGTGPSVSVTLVSLFCFVVSGALHWTARAYLQERR